MLRVRSRKRQGPFRSLNDGASSSSLKGGDCPVLLNVEHPKAKATSKRRGYETLAALKPAAEPFCAPVVAAVADEVSTLPAGDYTVRVTYGTVAGETDDARSSDPENPGPAEATVTVASGECIDVSVPFHVRKTGISDPKVWCTDENGEVQDTGLGSPVNPDCPDGEVVVGEQPPIEMGECECITCFTLSPKPVAVCDPSIFVGWPVFSRSPRMQDATGLGFNCNGDEPLYQRKHPLARVVHYDPATGQLCVDKALRFGALPDDLLVDLMMPDRNGLPIRHYNVYLKHEDDDDFFYAGTGVDGSSTLRICAYDTAATKAPSGRLDRTAPTVAAVDVVDDAKGLACGTEERATNITGGVFRVWITYNTCDEDILADPGKGAAGVLLGACDPAPPLRSSQETWPTASAVACLSSGQGLQVTVGELPDGVESYNVYVERMDPDDTRNWEEATRNPIQTNGGPPVPRPMAFYSGDSDPVHTVPDLRAQTTADVIINNVPMDARNVPFDEFSNTSIIDFAPLDPHDDDTRGFPPGYPDIQETVDADGWEKFLFGSSRDDLNHNRLHFWQFYDPIDDAALIANSTHAVIDIYMRWRRGSFADYKPTNDETGVIRLFNEGASGWDVLGAGYTPGPDFDHYRFCIEWDEARLHTYSDTNIPPAPFPIYRHLITDIYGLQGVGFDVDDITIETYVQDAAVDPLPVDAILQLEGETAPSVTLRHPLVGPGCAGRDDGPFKRLRLNPTADWEVVTSASPLVGVGASSDRYREMAGVADSIFVIDSRGLMTRVYQEEGEHWGSIVRYDWRFQEVFNRTYICNPALDTWNLRFDGEATYAMGLPIPSKVSETRDDAGNYLAPSVDPTNPILGRVDDPYLGEEEIGELVDILQIAEPGGAPPAGYITWEVDYFLVFKRVVRAGTSSYVSRSAPRLVLKEQAVRGDDSQAPALVLKVENLCPEAQVTHIELYRNPVRRGPDDALLVREWPLNSASIDVSTGEIVLSYDDTLPLTDDDLTIPINFDTGRPSPARFMFEDNGQLFFVPQRRGDMVAFCNTINQGTGAFDPESFPPSNLIDVPVKDSHGLTCLSAYAGGLLAHNNSGIAIIRRGASGFSADEFASSAGAAGPDAWVNLDTVQPIMTIMGPAVIVGGEVDYVGSPIQGTWRRANKDREVAYRSRCIDYRFQDGHQVWWTYSETACGTMDRVLLYDDEVNSRGDRKQLWARWDHMQVHGLAYSQGDDGVEFPLLGGNDGRVYRFGDAYTDCGIFIDAEIVGSANDESGADHSVQLEESTWTVTGTAPDVVHVELLTDYLLDDADRVHELEMDVPEEGERLWGDGWWSDPRWPIAIFSRAHNKRRLPHGAIGNAHQFRVRQRFEDYPTGLPREATFEINDVTLHYKQLGRRAVGAGAR